MRIETFFNYIRVVALTLSLVMLSTAAVSAQNNTGGATGGTATTRTDQDDDTDWGWIGLLGLAGLLGLMRRRDTHNVNRDTVGRST